MDENGIFNIRPRVINFSLINTFTKIHFCFQSVYMIIIHTREKTPLKKDSLQTTLTMQKSE